MNGRFLGTAVSIAVIVLARARLASDPSHSFRVCIARFSDPVAFRLSIRELPHTYQVLPVESLKLALSRATSP